MAVLVLTIVPTLPAAKPITLYLDWFPGPQFAGIYVAEAQGYYRAAGIVVETVPFAFGAKSAEAIASSRDCALGTIEGYIFLQRRAQGQDLQALAATLQESPAGVLSLAPLEIHSARDFAGRRIGVHAYADRLFRWFIAQAGLAPGAVKLVPVGDDLEVLIRGEVAAMQGYAIEEFVRLRQRTGRRARFASFRELGFDSYSEILYTTGAQWRGHRSVLETFLEATRRGWERALANPDETLAVLRKKMGPAMDEASVVAALIEIRRFISPDGRSPLAPMSAAKWRAMETACQEMGMIARVEPVETFLPELVTSPTRP